MPCKIEIKQNLTNKVSADTDSGFNLSIEGAQAVAKKVNQSYGIRVVSFSLNGDFIDRDIRIPDSLVDIYYNHELSLEQQEPVKAPVVIKPGVEELFNSTPELANTVYEALGFEIPTIKLEGRKPIDGKLVNFDVIEELASAERSDIPSSILIKKLLNGGYLPKINETDIVLGGLEYGIWRPNLKKIEAQGGNKSTLAKKVGHELLHSVTHNIIYSYQNLKGVVDFNDKYNKDNIRQGYIKPVDLNKSQIEALDNLVRIRNKVVAYVEQNKDKIQKQDRGFGTYDYFIRTNYTESETDLHEFISEVFTNPELINILKEIPTEGKKSNLFKNFVDAIAKILGFTNTSILEDIIAYSEEAFFTQPQITPQQKQQAQQLYSQYLDTIFPDSKIKDIVYHGTKKEFDKFDKSKLGSNLGYLSSDTKRGFYFGTLKEAKGYGMVYSAEEGKQRIIASILNIKNPKIVTSEEYVNIANKYADDKNVARRQEPRNFESKLVNPLIDIALKNKNDGLILEDIIDYSKGTQKLIFEPEQIHILGNENDIKGFKNFVAKPGDQLTMFQTDEMPASKASEETVSKIKELAKQAGISIQDLVEYAKANPNVNTKNANGLADIIKGIIAISQGRESEALTEEYVHIATAIIEQKNPQLITALISKIDRFKIYKQTLEAYKNKKDYQLPNGKPNIRKIKKEAVDKLITELIINQSEGSTEFPELMQEETRSMIREWWDAILDVLKQIYTKTNVELFETIAQQVVSGELGGTVADITTDEGVFLQIDPNPIIDAAYALQKSINDRMILVPEVLDSSGKMVKKRHYTLDGKDVGMSVTEKHQSGKKFPAKTDVEKARNAVKLKFGIDGHNFLENFITNNLIDKDGYAKAVPTNEPVETPLPSTVQEALAIFAKELIASYKPGTRFLIENMVINEKEKGMLGSTIDFKAFEPIEINGKPDMRVDTLDWKFTAVGEQDKEDIAWWNIKSWPKQMGEYIKMDRNHGITTEQTRKSRMIPFITSWKYNVAGDATSGIKLRQLEVGNVDPKKETKLYLMPVPLETESTGNKKVDTLVKSLRNYYDKLYPGSFGKSVEDKKDFLNQLSKAIRQLQVQINFEPIAIIGKQFLNNSARVLNTFEEMDYNVLSEDDINKRLGELLQLKDSALKFKTIDDVFKSVYNINELDAKNKVTLNVLTKVSGRTEEMLAKIARIEADYVVQLALKSKVTTAETKENILKPEVEISGLAKTFLEGTKLANRVINLASNLILKAKSLASIAVGKAINDFKPLILELEKEASRVGKTAFQMIGEEKNGRLRLIKKLNQEYYTKRDKAIEEQDKQFFLDNMDIVKFRELAAEKIKSRTEFIEDSVQSTDEEQNKIEIEKKITALRNSLDIDNKNFNGYDSFYFKEIFTKSLKEENFYSEDFKNMKKSDAAFKVWSMFTSWNKKAYEMGYLDEEGMAFFPLMEATIIQKFANTKDIIGVGKDFFDDLYKARLEEEVKFSKLDPETGKLRKVIPKYYTRTDKAVSQLSTDLTKVSALYIKALINYETSRKIENTLMVLHSVEQSKGTIMTDEGGIVYDGSEPSVDLENRKSADMLMTIIDDAVYGIGESIDSLGNTIISSAASSTTKTEEGKVQREVNIKKALDTSNTFIRALAVGLKPLLAAANYMGFNFQAYINAGNLYRYDKDFIGDHGTIVANRLSIIEKALLDYISPLNEDVAEERIRSISKEQSYTKWLGTWSFSDAMMSTNSIPERALGLTNALSMLKNSIVVDGKIVNIRQYLKEKDREGKYKLSQTERKSLEKTFEARVAELKKSDKTLAKIAKIENNQLVVPGISDEELAQLRVKIIENNRKLNGQMNRDDKAGFARDTIFKSFMMFKTWIPKQILTRAINLKKSNELNEWEFGRTRAFIEVWSHLGIKRITEINDIISGSEKGLAIMNEILKEKRDSYFRKTGQKLEITNEEFYDLMRQELSNQVKELKLLFGLMTLVLGVAAMQPPEDADELTKNHYKYLMKLTHKISDELSFYYNPVSFESMTKGSILPQLGLGTKIITLANALAKEGYYTATGEEKEADKTYPLKYFFNLIPVGYQLQTDVLPLVFPEAAKDMGIRVTPQSRQ